MIEVVRQLLANKKIQIVEGAVCSDHAHLSIRIPPKYSVAQIMGCLKGKSSLMLFDRHPVWRCRQLDICGYFGLEVPDGCAPAVKTINSKTGRKKKSAAQA